MALEDYNSHDIRFGDLEGPLDSARPLSICPASPAGDIGITTGYRMFARSYSDCGGLQYPPQHFRMRFVFRDGKGCLYLTAVV